MLLEGRKVFITGASRGIGAACAGMCAREGAFVGIAYRSSDESARKVLDGIEREGGKGVLYRLDVSDPSTIKPALDDFSSRGCSRTIHGLIINAGIYTRRGFSDLTEDDWKRTLSTNLDGSFLTVRESLNHMVGGSIVFISSQLAFRGSASGADYAASKAGMLGLARSLARELAPGIRVNSIAPGYIDTDILSGDSPKKRAGREEEVPLGRVGSPEEVAGAVVFLLSELSSYITGATIDVNGGLFIH